MQNELIELHKFFEFIKAKGVDLDNYRNEFSEISSMLSTLTLFIPKDSDYINFKEPLEMNGGKIVGIHYYMLSSLLNRSQRIPDKWSIKAILNKDDKDIEESIPLSKGFIKLLIEKIEAEYKNQ